MAKKSKDPLSSFLREVLNWNWVAYLEAEHDTSYTSNQATVFALIRACYAQDLRALRATMNRADGKLKTVIKVELPKIFYLYPYAEGTDQSLPQLETAALTVVDGVVEVIIEASDDEPLPDNNDDLPTLSLRQTVRRMAQLPRQLPKDIRTKAHDIELAGRGVEWPRAPMVKSVVAASLLLLAQKASMDAILEVFDQIDGKLVDTIQLLGEDMFITSFANQAPPGAYKNKDGIYQLEAAQAQDFWAAKLANQAKAQVLEE